MRKIINNKNRPLKNRVLTPSRLLQRLRQIRRAANLFDPDSIADNFTHMDSIFKTTKVAASKQPYQFSKSRAYSLPSHFVHENEKIDTQDFLEHTGTTGLIVLNKGDLIWEKYFQHHRPDLQHISWSVAKSILSCLIGIAIHEGYIKSVRQPVSKYVPLLSKSAYAHVPLKAVLQMSSGVQFNEDYASLRSDVARLWQRAVIGGSFNRYGTKLKGKYSPGQMNRYSSFDTQVLAMVLQNAVGRSVSQYMSEKLWQKIGAETDGYWIIDSEGMEMGFGGFNATLRDYAKFGLLYLQKGQWQGEQIVPSSWITDSLTMDTPAVQPGEDNPFSDHPFGYGYQWWIPENPEREYLAIGVYNQYIYISPKSETVIVKTSANHRYLSDPERYSAQSITLFRTICDDLS